MRPALLVIDVQKAFFDIDQQTTQSLHSAIETINAAIALFRGQGLSVVAVQHMEAEEGLVPGAGGFALPEQLAILDSDLHIVKTYGNAFNRTPLEDELRRLDVDTVILTGFCAEYCVLSTCRGAKDRDLTPIILRDALASSVPDNIRFVENVNDVISYGALKKVLE
jgi:nicotinamidase-related amidase